MYQDNLFKAIEELGQKQSNVLIGIASNCQRLNVREEPEIGAKVLCEIIVSTEVMIDAEESTEEFYKIYTAAGIDGFCMKKFIEVQ